MKKRCRGKISGWKERKTVPVLSPNETKTAKTVALTKTPRGAQAITPCR